MTIGIISIAFSYLLIVTVLFWMFSEFPKSKLACAFFVPLCIWYSLVLVFYIHSLFGYPSTDPIPDGAIVKGIHINEPSKGYDGVMCFWMINTEDYGKVDAEPRAYKMPYDRELHKQLIREGSKKSGIMRWHRSKKSGKKGLKRFLGDGSDMSKGGEFKVLNPSEFLSKDSITVGSNKKCECVCE